MLPRPWSEPPVLLRIGSTTFSRSSARLRSPLRSLTITGLTTDLSVGEVLSFAAPSGRLIIDVASGLLCTTLDSDVLLRIGSAIRFLSVLPLPLSEPEVLSRTGVTAGFLCVLVDSDVLLRIGSTTRFLSVLPCPLSEPEVLLRIGVTTAEGFLLGVTGVGVLDGALAT
jgi:hypothetical protein